MRRLLGLPIASLALVMGLSACTGNSPGGQATPAPAATEAPSSGGSLEFATVEELTAPRFQADAVCRYGEWHENSTGVNDEYLGAVSFFRQFDCYESEEDAQGGFSIPDRVQQSIFVEFKDEATARKYAEDEGENYSALIAGTKVVVPGSGLESVDMKAYLTDLQKACGCGEIIAPAQ